MTYYAKPFTINGTSEDAICVWEFAQLTCTSVEHWRIEMNVLSLFDGKSSGFTACELAGIEVGTYYSSEVDKYAIKVSDAIHPNQVRLGDVTKWREWDIDWGSH